MTVRLPFKPSRAFTRAVRALLAGHDVAPCAHCVHPKKDGTPIHCYIETCPKQRNTQNAQEGGRVGDSR